MSVTIIGNTIPAVPIIDLGIEVVFKEQVVLTDDQFNQSEDLKQLLEKTLILLAEGEIPPSQGVSEADIICPTGPSNCNIRSGAIVLDHFSTDVRNLLDSLSVTRFIWVQDPNFVDNPDNSISWSAGKIALGLDSETLPLGFTYAGFTFRLKYQFIFFDKTLHSPMLEITKTGRPAILTILMIVLTIAPVS